MNRFPPLRTLLAPVVALLFVPSALAASFYEQKKAAMDTAYAIENTRKSYEEESRAAAEYAELRESWHQQARQAAEASTRLHPLLADTAKRQIASVESGSSGGVERVNPDRDQATAPRAPRSNTFVESSESIAGADSVSDAEQESTVLFGNVTELRVEPRRPKASVVSLMHATEDKLIDLHDHGRIGSFDMDKFSERLLGIKKNYFVMISSRPILSARQEEILRSEMRGLEKDISDRAN